MLGMVKHPPFLLTVTIVNNRYYITDVSSLKRFFKNSENIYVTEDEEGYSGIVLVWKSFGGNQKRYYVKLNAKTPDIARNLLTALVWNDDREMFVKVRKNSKFLSVFKSKGFRFKGGRGIQILLRKKKYKPREKLKEVKEHERNTE